MTRFSGSQSFQELTIFAMVHSFLEHALTMLATMRNRMNRQSQKSDRTVFADVDNIAPFLFTCNKKLPSLEDIFLLTRCACESNEKARLPPSRKTRFALKFNSL
ncbi:hypothetical protein, partial [Adlercreutzia caecimuris]|uniref:hypothetical protein n=1 Tax=Adlercreutzia caecimuris TaxID=671266 RepID=UPI00272D5A9A